MINQCDFVKKKKNRKENVTRKGALLVLNPSFDEKVKKVF
jgi:hypothetical protein